MERCPRCGFDKFSVDNGELVCENCGEPVGAYITGEPYHDLLEESAYQRGRADAMLEMWGEHVEELSHEELAKFDKEEENGHH